MTALAVCRAGPDQLTGPDCSGGLQGQSKKIKAPGLVLNDRSRGIFYKSLFGICCKGAHPVSRRSGSACRHPVHQGRSDPEGLVIRESRT